MERLGLTLVHFLWEATAITGLYAIVRRMLGTQCNPNLRYILACAAMAGMMVATLVTFAVLRPVEPGQAAAPMAQVPIVPGLAGVGTRLPIVTSINATRAGTLTWIVVLWFAGSVAFSVRLVGGLFAAERTFSRHLCAAPLEWQDVFTRLSRRMGVFRRIRLMVCVQVHAPIVIGWIRPIVLLPIAALTGLASDQVEALLAHELAHIRRCDYLVNILQSVGEALFFYHPGVWWVSGHIRTERELCCDDTAVAVSGDVLTYARALTALELSRPILRSDAVAANGGSLETRIARLLGESCPASSRQQGISVVVIAVLLAVTASAMFGQMQGPLRFETASIERNLHSAKDTLALNNTRNPGFVNILPGRLSARWTVLRTVIQQAWGLEPFQVGEGPDWMNTERFDIDATAASTASSEEILMMLQALLEDRFKLKVHYETIDIPVYDLTVGRGGLRLSESKNGGCYRGGGMLPPPPPPPGTPWLQPPLCGRAQVSLISATEARLTAGSISTTQLAADLSKILGSPVVDRTGYTPTFDVDVTFLPDRFLAGLRGSGSLILRTADNGSRSILSALEDQVGLRLVPTKGPLKFLIIDSVEKPSAN